MTENTTPEGTQSIAPFIVQATDTTPSVSFIPDKLFFNISGNATSFQTAEIFFNAGKWIIQYDKQLDLLQRENKIQALNLVFEFNLVEANNACLEALKILISRIELTNSRDVHIQIKWHYNSSNEKIKSFLQQYIDGYRIFFETINEKGVPSFFIHPTDISPKIFFDTPNSVFRISGTSRPEHPRAFYNQIEKWIECNGKQWMMGHPFDIKMRYYNTSSKKCLTDLLFLINKIYRDEKQGLVNWYYDFEDNEEVEIIKEEFEPILQNLHFNYIPRKGKEFTL